MPIIIRLQGKHQYDKVVVFNLIFSVPHDFTISSHSFYLQISASSMLYTHPHTQICITNKCLNQILRSRFKLHIKNILKMTMVCKRICYKSLSIFTLPHPYSNAKKKQTVNNITYFGPHDVCNKKVRIK